jgi:hypothetical protein
MAGAAERALSKGSRSVSEIKAIRLLHAERDTANNTHNGTVVGP